MKKYIGAIVILFLLFSCSSANKTHSLLVKMNNKQCMNMNLRKTIAEVNKLGVIIKNNYGDYLIKSEDGLFYFACNLPRKYKKEDLEINFLGEEKETYPNEKTIGRFLILKMIGRHIDVNDKR